MTTEDTENIRQFFSEMALFMGNANMSITPYDDAVIKVTCEKNNLRREDYFPENEISPITPGIQIGFRWLLDDHLAGISREIGADSLHIVVNGKRFSVPRLDEDECKRILASVVSDETTRG